MHRFLFSLVLGLTVVGSSTAADAKIKPTTLRWYGQSFFQLTTSKGTRIVFDPHNIEAYGRTNVEADVVVISHRHNDHTQTEILANKGKFKEINGVEEKGRRSEWNLVDEKFKDVRIRAIGTYHDTTMGMERGKNAIFVVEADGMNIVFLGDLGHLLSPAQIKLIGPVDVLLIPVGGVYTLNGDDAKKVQEQLKPRKYVIPMHYGTRVFDDLLPATEFLEDQKNIKRYDANKLDLDRDFKPATPEIAILLRWK